MKILYVSQYFPPEMGAPAARVAELSRLWVNEGHQVEVLTGFPNHPTGVVPAKYRKQLRRLVVHERADGVHVTRTWLLPLPNRRSWERGLNYSSFSLSAAMTGTFLPKADVVIGSSPQLLVGLSAWWIARRQGVPFVFEVRDLWPESLAAVGAGSPQSILHRALSWVAGFLYRNSDHVVVVTRAFKTYLAEHWHVPLDKISVVENGVDPRLFSPGHADARIRQELDAEEKFIVSYIGTMGMAHGLETLLETAHLLQLRAPKVLFLLVGEGAEKQQLVNLAKSQGLTNVRFVGQQSREHIPAFICASNACLVMLKKADLFKTVLPTKLLEFMSCARPVILTVDGEARRIMDEAGAGIYVDPQNAGDLAAAIMQLAGDPQLCSVLGRNGRDYVVGHFARQQTATRYIKVLESVCRLNPMGAVPAAA